MARPLFSVLIPAYNCESTLLASVSSALADRNVPVEVVIVDDASTDMTPSIVDAIARTHEAVKVIHAERNRGDGPSRNAGLEQVTGEWLVLLDSDDLLEKGALARIADHIGRSPKTPDVYITRYFERDVVSNARWRLDECFPDEYAGKGPIDPAPLADHLFSTVRSVIANKVWSIDFLRDNKLIFQDIPRVGDVFFTLGTLAQASSIEFLDVELYEYRLNHGTSLTSTGDRYPSSFAEAAEALHAFLDERGLLDVWETGFLNWFNENTFYNLVSMKTLAGFSELLSRLQKTTFPLVRFGNLRREDAVSQADYDRNVLLQDQSVDEVLFSGLRMVFSSRDDQFYRAEYHLFNEVNSRREADWKIHLLKNELERANSSLSMKVGLAATLVPRKAKAALLSKRRQQSLSTILSTFANPIVSVIVPAYNVKPYLWECLDSILGQTFADFELILVDDGSTDGTPEECDEYARRDPRVTVIHQANSGPSGARNAGIKIARGQWIAFVDSDDRIHPEYLSTLLSAAIGTGSEVAVCGVQRFSDGAPAALEPIHEGVIVRSGRDMCMIMDEYKGYYYTCLWGKVYKRCLFDNVVLPVGTIYEDEFVSFKVMYGCDSVAEVGRVLYGYRDNPTGIINSGFSIHRADRVASMEERMAFFAEHGEQELYEKARSNRDEFLGWLVENAKANGVYDELPERYRLMYEKRENGSTDHTG